MKAEAGFRERLHSGPPVLLDGPMGTELTRRGIETTLPLWSAWALLQAPEAVQAIHESYLQAGAEVLTTNTFRTHRRSLNKAGHGERAAELTTLAVSLGRQAIASAAPGREVFLAGSVAPLEDCYSPQLTPHAAALEAEHAEIVQHLESAGVDLFLVETMPTILEAVAATRAATATGSPVLVGLVCDTRGRLMSGESVADAAHALEPLGPDALLINCTPTEAVHTALAALAAATDLPVGAYGNVGHAEDQQGWTLTDTLDPAAYAEHARTWLTLGARLVGTCCGTGPEHVQELAHQLTAPLSPSPTRKGPPSW